MAWNEWEKIKSEVSGEPLTAMRPNQLPAGQGGGSLPGGDLVAHQDGTFRMTKQTLGWTRLKLRTPAAADRRTWLIIAAHTQRRLSRPLAADLRSRPNPADSPRPRSAGRSGSSPEPALSGPCAETQPARPRMPARLEEPASRHPL